MSFLAPKPPTLPPLPPPPKLPPAVSEDLTNEQNDGFGLELSYTFLDTGSDDSGWEMFTKYWNIEDSTTNSSTGSKWIVTGMEPLNETFEIGFKRLF